MSSKKKFLVRFLEFFIIGICLGLVEDLIAIHFATNAEITRKIVLIAFLAAFPFAVFTELIVDHPKFWSRLFRLKEEQKISQIKKP
jgi:hypothetical protein